MTVGEIKDRVMFQTNNDIEDVDDYEPYLLQYINDAYDRMVYAYKDVHLSDDDDSEYTELIDNLEEPNLPFQYHYALADWATWLVYRNGNPQKQQRGYQYRESFETVLLEIKEQRFDKIKHFRNMPR